VPRRLPASWFALVVLAVLLLPTGVRAQAPTPQVYVILWFDTEDYLLPASDDAALRVAEFLTREGIRATFKVVGEKARTLERRKRFDVIAALKKHEIGFHANYHSVQPTPALYLSNLGWDEGVAEFDRREGPGRADVERVFGVAPSCYGQPGSSWGPQSYGAMRKWGMKVYLDAGRHVALDGQPCYYAGLLNLYQLRWVTRCGINDPKDLEKAQEQFAGFRKQILTEGGGVVSIYYHPCEWVHKQFWDGVNFSKGANPPRSQWKPPPQKTPEETKLSYRIFSDYIAFLKRFPEVKFITASEATRLYADRARDHAFTDDELKQIAKTALEGDLSFQKHKGYTLSAAEVFWLLNDVVADFAAGRKPETRRLGEPPIGPTGKVTRLTEPVTTDLDQLERTSQDVAEFLRKQGRIPSAVWLGSTPVPPEAYLQTLARVALDRLEDRTVAEKVEVKPARLGVVKYVSEDDPKLWGWVIFPPNFRAPAMMELARQQAWSLKPAVLAKAR
jgi:hypothetical protein